MSGKKRMKQYPASIKDGIRKQLVAGRSQREISREYGISQYSIQSWCGLRPETKLQQIAPLPKGRPKADKTIDDYKKENARLKIENELLRDFVQSVERK